MPPWSEELALKHQGGSKWGRSHPRSSTANFWNVNFWPMYPEYILDIRGGQSHQRSLSAIFQKCHFWPPRSNCMCSEGHLDIRGGQHEVKVIQGHYKCDFLKFIFSLSCTKNTCLKKASEDGWVSEWVFSKNVEIQLSQRDVLWFTLHLGQFRHKLLCYTVGIALSW